jgi:hypothetical protein
MRTLDPEPPDRTVPAKRNNAGIRIHRHRRPITPPKTMFAIRESIPPTLLYFHLT